MEAYYAVVFLFIIYSTPSFADIPGKPCIIDGDMIEVAGERIRPHGIDAPEAKQICLTKNDKDTVAAIWRLLPWPR